MPNTGAGPPPLTMEQAQARAAADTLVQIPTVVGQRPDEPGYLARIQAPDPLPTSAEEAAVAQILLPNGTPAVATPPALCQYRVVVSFGRDPKTVVLSIEEAPYYDMVDGASWLVPLASVRDLLPALQVLAKVKNLTGQELYDARPRPRARAAAPRAGAGGRGAPARAEA